MALSKSSNWLASLVSNLKESHENTKSIIFQSHVSKVDQNENSTYSYCCTDLGAVRSTKKTNNTLENIKIQYESTSSFHNSKK